MCNSGTKKQYIGIYIYTNIHKLPPNAPLLEIAPLPPPRGDRDPAIGEIGAIGKQWSK